MKEHKAKVLVLQDGRVVVEGVPVRAGQNVEVSIRFEEQAGPAWPLKGLPVKLKDPFLPAVPESDWDSES